MQSRASGRKHVQRYRDRMRRAGFRLVQMWVPDTRGRGFADECQRQSRLASKKTRAEREVMDFIDATRDDEGWTP